jgi:N-acetyl-alpha-D-glucosaminyl L-malate synthase BshA
VDVQRFDKKPLDAFRKVLAPNGERIIAHASNFRKVKRVNDIIRIFANINKVVPSKLLMVGDGPDRPGAEELCRELGICDDVRFLGKQQEMEEILAISDMFILTSEYESFGLSALEAMAAGVPVLSSNAGGIPEINIHGETGFMANIGDINELSKLGIELLKDEEKLQYCKQKAKEQAAKFDIHYIVPLYEELYERFVHVSATP